MVLREARLPVVPMELRGEVRWFSTTFKFSRVAKEVVSHLELQAWLSSVGFTIYGENIRVTGLELSFPGALPRSHPVTLWVRLFNRRRIRDNVWIVKLSVRAIDVTNCSHIMEGRVTILVGDLEPAA